MNAESSTPPALTVDVGDEGDHAALHGSLDIRTLGEAEKSLEQWTKKRKSGALDLRVLSGLDTTRSVLLCVLRNTGTEWTAISAAHQALLDLIGGLELKPLPKVASVPRWRQLVIQLGKGADDAWHDTLDVITFVGRAASAIGHGLIHPRTLLLPSISRHIEETGIHALPIIGLVAVSMLREMGVLITAIMVAGRSGSAFAAEIGVMKARDEVDALKVMGMDPIAMLVVPRLIALVITLPLLTFFSDVMGLFGGAMISRFLLDVSPLQYVERVHQAVDARDLFVGLFKAPVFGFLIAVIGCMHGLRVRGSAESVGGETTRAVVKAILVVVVLDR